MERWYLVFYRDSDDKLVCKGLNGESLKKLQREGIEPIKIHTGSMGDVLDVVNLPERTYEYRKAIGRLRKVK